MNNEHVGVNMRNRYLFFDFKSQPLCQCMVPVFGETIQIDLSSWPMAFVSIIIINNASIHLANEVYSAIIKLLLNNIIQSASECTIHNAHKCIEVPILSVFQLQI